ALPDRKPRIPSLQPASAHSRIGAIQLHHQHRLRSPSLPASRPVAQLRLEIPPPLERLPSPLQPRNRLRGFLCRIFGIQGEARINVVTYGRGSGGTEAELTALLIGYSPYGVACARANPFCTANNSFSTPRSFRESSAFGPSDLASFGLSWTSIKIPSTPAA